MANWKRLIKVDLAELAQKHWPRFMSANKKAVFSRVSQEGPPLSGELVFTRWGTEGWPPRRDEGVDTVFEVHKGVFEYSAPQPGSVEWHMNFADQHLFGYYGGSLLAQDEHQVLEHPILASLVQALQSEVLLTTEHGHPTPILISGVPRQCFLATNPDAQQGRPNGLYGQQFAGAPVAAVMKATKVLQPPTISNILCMEAPKYGHGVYQREEIRHILSIAYSGFVAARRHTDEFLLMDGKPQKLVIHAGFWGCGAYGGNKLIMTVIQLVAARAAGVDRLVFHTVTPDGLPVWQQALDFLQSDAYVKAVESNGGEGAIEAIAGLKARWGVSNGT